MTVQRVERKLETFMERAVAEALDETMEEAVQYARKHHPGWKRRSGRAERAVRVIRKAAKQGVRFFGIYGVSNLAYIRRLEFQHGRFLDKSRRVVRERFPVNLRNALIKLRRRN